MEIICDPIVILILVTLISYYHREMRNSHATKKIVDNLLIKFLLKLIHSSTLRFAPIYET